MLRAAAHLPILAAVATFFPYAYRFERGRNTVWAVALVHFASDTIKLVLFCGALADPATQTATMLWLVVIAAVPYLAFVAPSRKQART